jgi:hypothetical protein
MKSLTVALLLLLFMKANGQERFISRTIDSAIAFNKAVVKCLPEFTIAEVDSSRMPNELRFILTAQSTTDIVIYYRLTNAIVRNIYVGGERSKIVSLYRQLFKPTSSEEDILKKYGDYVIVGQQKAVFEKSAYSSRNAGLTIENR